MKKQYIAPALQTVEFLVCEPIGVGYDDISSWSPIKPLE